jgi:hypothetical protein
LGVVSTPAHISDIEGGLGVGLITSGLRGMNGPGNSRWLGNISYVPRIRYSIKARLTSRTSDELHLVVQLSGLSCPLLTGLCTTVGSCSRSSRMDSRSTLRSAGMVKQANFNKPLQATYGCVEEHGLQFFGSARCRHTQSARETRHVTASVLNSQLSGSPIDNTYPFVC